MDKYKWKNRILLVYTPDRQNKKYLQTKNKFDKFLYKFHKVFLILKTKKSNKFYIELIGFDGTVKKTYTKLSVTQVLKDISKMPMGKLTNPKNLSLYADYNPETTTPKLGFKNEEKAKYTIDKIKDRDITYQKRVIVTMINRAKYHPHKTKDMDKAIKIFEKKLKELKK